MHQDIKAIGVYDRGLDLFESQYAVPEGISYNSYVITDERQALVDTVDSRAAAPWRAAVEEAFAGTDGPAYLVTQHLEPDHASQIQWVMDRFPGCRMVCTAVALKMLPRLVERFDFADRVDTVADGATLSLGRHELRFITAPMVHWPEVMMVYDAAARTLFSADAFGRFGDPSPEVEWEPEARRYYFNIVGKYGAQVLAVLGKLAGLPIDCIAPLHGPVLEGDLGRYIALYRRWAGYMPEADGVLVAYASIHGMTAAAAREMAAMLRQAGAAEVVVTDLSRCDQAHAVQEAFRLSRMVVMAPTYDGDLFPPMHDFLHHLALKGWRGRRVGIVENGLWAPAAARRMREMLEGMRGVVIAEPVVTLRGRLTDTERTAMRSLAAGLMAD